VLFASCSAKADVLHTSEHMGSNIGTARVVAEVFRELFFAPVRIRDARLDRYLRNWEPPGQMIKLLWVDDYCASNFRFRPGRGSRSVCGGRRLRLFARDVQTEIPFQTCGALVGSLDFHIELLRKIRRITYLRIHTPDCPPALHGRFGVKAKSRIVYG
jgi:hypothetical protein